MYIIPQHNWWQKVTDYSAIIFDFERDIFKGKFPARRASLVGDKLVDGHKTISSENSPTINRRVQLLSRLSLLR
jgi:hypothetical protein